MSDTYIRITTDTDTIVFTGDDIAAGYIYDNVSLDAWYSTPDVTMETEARPNAHGDYSPDQTYATAASIPFQGQFFGADRLAAAVARNRLAGLYNDGKRVTVQVVDPLMTTTRTGYLRGVDIPWTPHQQLTWSFELYAPDPRRYGATQTLGPVGLPSASSGLVWPLGTANKTIYAWTGTPNASTSTASISGVVQRTNVLLDPAAALAGDIWESRWFGGGAGAGTFTHMATGGPSQASASFVRKQWTAAANTAQDTGFNVGGAGGGNGIVAAPGGASFSFSGWMRSSKAAVVYARTASYLNASQVGSEQNSANVTLVPNVWTRISITGTVEATANGFNPVLEVSGNTASWVTGDYIDGAGALLEWTSTVGSYFDGATPTNGSSSRFWEWGTIANLGQLTVTNTGNTSTSPTITVGAGGRFVSGFQVVEVETGRVLSYAVGTSSNDQVTLNNRTRRATLNGGGDVTGNLVIRQWFSVPPGASRRYQLVTLGAVSGTPTFSINTAAAYL